MVKPLSLMIQPQFFMLKSFWILDAKKSNRFLPGEIPRNSMDHLDAQSIPNLQGAPRKRIGLVSSSSRSAGHATATVSAQHRRSVIFFLWRWIGWKILTGNHG